MRAHLDRIADARAAIGRLPRARRRASARRVRGGSTRRSPERERRPAPPLAGVPLAVKDILHVDRASPTSCGSRMLADYRPPFEATVVTRLEAAGRDRRRQDEHGRVRDGLVDRAQRLQADAQPLGPRARARRLVGRLGGGGRVAHGAARARHGHRRLDPPAGRALRRRRPQADLGPRQPLRRRRVRLLARPGGPAGAARRGPGLAASVLCGHDPHDATSAARAVPDLAAALPRGARAACGSACRGASSTQGVEPETLVRFEESLRALQAAGAIARDVELEHLPHAIPTYYLVATAEASSNLARYDGVRYGARAAGARDLRRALRRDARRRLRRRRSSAASCSAPSRCPPATTTRTTCARRRFAR